MMTARQTKSFIRLALSNILELLETMPQGEERTKLENAAELLKQTLDD